MFREVGDLTLSLVHGNSEALGIAVDEYGHIAIRHFLWGPFLEPEVCRDALLGQ
jgi:hypothetical protein